LGRFGLDALNNPREWIQARLLMTKRNLRSLSFAAAAFVIAAVALLSACGEKQQNPAAAGGPGAAAQRPAAPVIVAAAAQRDIPVEITAIGNVEAYQTVQVRSMVSGQIEGVHFKEGQDVSKGQLLFTLDKRPFQAVLDQAIGQLKRDQATAQNYQMQATRYTSLEQQGVISREVADQQRTQAQSTLAAVAADQATVDAARVQLQYTDIKAPISGRAGAILINLGNLVKANDTPFLVQINQITPIYVTFSVPENQLDQIRSLAAHHLKVLAFPKGTRTGGAESTLTFIDNGVDPTTGTVKLKATSTNQDRRLWPGEYVDVVMDLSTIHNAVVVPTKAIQTGQQGQYVYVVTPQNTAESRVVVTSGAYQDLTIVSKGVAPGDKVVVEGQMRVAPNSKVAVQSTVPTGTTPAGAAPNAPNPSQRTGGPATGDAR
jgi:multidrug efflux system membrane fusion protein